MILLKPTQTWLVAYQVRKLSKDHLYSNLLFPSMHYGQRFEFTQKAFSRNVVDVTVKSQKWEYGRSYGTY